MQDGLTVFDPGTSTLHISYLASQSPQARDNNIVNSVVTGTWQLVPGQQGRSLVACCSNAIQHVPVKRHHTSPTNTR